MSEDSIVIWFDRLLSLWRERAAKEGPDIAKAVSNLDDLSAPCQIHILHLESPSIAWVFITHFGFLPDGLIRYVGPLKLSELFDGLEKFLLDMPDRSIEDPHLYPPTSSLRTLFDSHLESIAREAVQLSLSHSRDVPSTCLGGKRYLLDRSAVWQAYGVPSEPPEKSVDGIFTEAQGNLERQRKRQHGTDSPGPSNPPDDSTMQVKTPDRSAWGTFLYPSIRIGAAERKEIRRRFFPTHFPSLGKIVLEGRIGHLQYYCTKDGFVIIEGIDRLRSVTFFNMLILAMRSRGIRGEAVRENDLGRVSFSGAGAMTGWEIPDARLPSEVASWRRGPREVDAEVLVHCLQEAETHLQSRLAPRMEAFLHARGYLEAAHYSVSFFLGWLVAEQCLGDIWRGYLGLRSIT